MSGERELLDRDLDEGRDPAAEITAEEERHVVTALRAAWVPGPLDEAALDAIVNGALGEPDAAEVRDASAMAAALTSAYAPKPIDPRVNDALVETALFRARRAPRRLALPLVTGAIAGAVAIAASFVMFFRAADAPSASAPSAASIQAASALVRTRSAQELFDPATPFPRHGGETARIDRIMTSRASDLRKNRFHAWGVRGEEKAR